MADRLVRESLHDQVVQRLRDMIVQGELAPGDRIDDKRLCQRFGISRTPFREALRVLSAEALVELVPHRSARVAPITQDHIRELFDVMAWLERYGGQFAAVRAREADVRALETHLAKMERLHAQGNRLEYFYKNREFHWRLMELAGNAVLLATYHTLLVQIQRARYIAIHSKAHWDRGIKEHRRILKALVNREAEQLGLLLMEHSEETGRRVEAIFTRTKNVARPELSA
jgi:DNA-binding GntR family transcriptional regulator